MKKKKSTKVIDNSGLVRLPDSILNIAREYKEKTGVPITKYIEEAILEKSGQGEISTAIETLRNNFKDKSEGSYYYVWQASIAMAFIDNERWYREKTGKRVLSYADRYTVANEAAKYFLDLLVKTSQIHDKSKSNNHE